jgi:hypothetical protein
MTNKEQKIVIDGVTFQVGPFMAVEGLRLKAHLVRTFGPALGELLGGINSIKDVGNLNLGGESISKGLEKPLEQLNENSFEALIKRLLTNVIANWQEGGRSHSVSFGQDFETAMEVVFLGRLFSIYPLLIFILKVNYPDFFDKVVGGIGKRVKITPTSTTGEETLRSDPETSEQSEN